MVKETICLQCGDRGYENALVYCVRCLNFAVHRYCLDEIPETFDEFVCWLCDVCKVKVRKQSAVFKHDATPCQTRHHEVADNFESFSKNGKNNNGPVLVEANEHISKDASGQTHDDCAKLDSVECGEQSAVFEHDATPCQTRSREVSENIESFSENGKKNGPVLVEANEHVCKDDSGQTRDDCANFDSVECGEKSVVFEHDATPCQRRHHEVSENSESYSENGKKNGPVLVEANEHICKDASGQTRDDCAKFDSVECGEKSAVLEHDATPCQTRRHEVSENIDNFSENGKKNGPVEANELVCKDASGQTCDDCAKFDSVECGEKFAVFEHDATPCQTRRHAVSENIDNFYENGKKNGPVPIEANEHVCKDASGKTCDDCAKFDSVECGEKFAVFEHDATPCQTRRHEVSENIDNFSENGPVPVEANEHVCKDASVKTCDDCAKFYSVECGEQSAVIKHDAIPCQTRHHEVSENIESVSENGKKNGPVLVKANEHVCKDASGQTCDACAKFELVECGESASQHILVKLNRKTDENAILLPVDASKISQQSSSLHQLEEEKAEGNLIGSIKLSAGCLKKKKSITNKDKRNIVESTTEKDQHGLATTCYEECVKVDINECIRLASDSTLATKVKENECSEQKDREKMKIKNMKRKRMRERNIVESTAEKDQHGLATACYEERVKADINECTRLASGSTLATKVKENECSEQKDREKMKIKNMKRKRMRERNIVECTAEKDQHGLATACYEERVKADINECTRLASGSTLASKVKENECSQQKDREIMKIKNMTRKRMRERNIVESTAEKDQHGLSTACYEERVKADINACTRLASDSTLASKVRENECSEQKDVEKKKIKNRKSQMRKKMRERNIVESIAEKDQHGLATACYEERVKIDINECTRLASDSTLALKVKETECSEEKDREKKKTKNMTRKRMRERNIVESTAEKDQHGLATACYEERVKANINECTRLASDSTLASKVRENECSEQKDGEKKIKNRKSRMRKKMRERNIVESITEKDQHGLATACYEERVKIDINKCTRLASDSTLALKVKETECSEEKDREKKKIKNMKSRKRERMRERNIVESTAEKDQHGLATACYEERVKADINECTRLASDSTLASKVRENECSEKKDVEKKKIKNRKSRMRKKMREGHFVESTAEKGQHGLATASYEERVKVDISESTRSARDSTLPSKLKQNECSEQRRLATVVSYDERVKVDINKCTRSASDSTLPSKVKENECSEQKDQTCISKPFDSITDLGITVVPADHPVISSDGPSNSSKKKKTITSSETISLKQVDRTGVAQPLHTYKPLYLQNQLADLCTEEKDLGSSNGPIENTGSEHKEEQTFTSCQSKNTCTNYPKKLGFSVAQPIAMPIWRGSFNIWNKKHGNIDELIAHISDKACYKVYEEASQLQPFLRLEMLPKSDIWPNSFQRAEPNGDNIALYFFPSKISTQVFEQLVEEMMHKELAFKALVQNAELLIFTSTELPLRYWRFRNKYYLWGVFRGKQANPRSSLGEVAEIPLIRKRRDDRSPTSPLNNSLH